MKNAVIVHGKANKDDYYNPALKSPSNYHWIPWLQKQLLVNGILAQTPELPRPYEPDYLPWKTEFERFDVNEETILVGHSAGAGFLVRWLSEHKDARAGKAILVAPSIDADRKYTTDIFHFDIDRELAGRVGEIVLFNSDDDSGAVHRSVTRIRDSIPGVAYREFHGYGHFCQKDMKSVVFPELLEACLNEA